MSDTISVYKCKLKVSKTQQNQLIPVSKCARAAYNVSASILQDEDQRRGEDVLEQFNEWKNTHPVEGADYDALKAKYDAEMEEYYRVKPLAQRGKCLFPSKPVAPPLPVKLKPKVEIHTDASGRRSVWSRIRGDLSFIWNNNVINPSDYHLLPQGDAIMPSEGLFDATIERRSQGFSASMPGVKPWYCDHPIPIQKGYNFDIEFADVIEGGRQIRQWTMVLNLAKKQEPLRLRFYPNRKDFSADKVTSAAIGRNRGENSWWASFRVRIPTESKDLPDRTLGVDVNSGSGNTVVVATKDGELYRRSLPTHRLDQLHSKLGELQREKNKVLDLNGDDYKSRKASRLRRRIRRLHKKMANIRENSLHHFSKELVLSGKTIVLEELDIPKMTKSAKGTVDNPGVNVALKADRNRKMLGIAAGKFKDQIVYKSNRIDNSSVIMVNPAYSSQKCCYCGERGLRDVKKNPKNFTCLNKACSYYNIVRDADENAAMNHARAAEAGKGDIVAKKAGKKTKTEIMTQKRRENIAGRKLAAMKVTEPQMKVIEPQMKVTEPQVATPSALPAEDLTFAIV